MKRLYTTLTSLGFIAMIGLLSTCHKEKDTPVLTSLTPATGAEGTAVVVTGSFLAKTTSIKFGTAEALVVNPQATSVNTQVPPGLPLGEIKVSVIADGNSSNELSFTVLPQVPELKSITPNEGASGAPVVIRGSHLLTTSQVIFGLKSTTAIDVKTDSTLALKVPDGLDMGAVDVSVVTDGGNSAKITYTIVGSPNISNFTPVASPPGTLITISGSNFLETKAVTFNGVAAGYQVLDVNTLHATVPASATTGKIKVTTPGGESSSQTDFIVIGAPVVSSFSPASGPIGTELTVSGSNFSAPQLSIAFTGAQATTFHAVSDTQLKATVPPGTSSGTFTITTAAGSGTSTGSFTIVGAPSISGISPGTGSAGTDVVITGSEFSTVTSVKFNGKDATPFTINSGTKITARVPAGATSGPITVTNAAGSVNSATFTVIGTPVVSGFTPTNGIAGTPVVITGSSFTGTTAVKFNGKAAASFTLANDGQINASVASGTTSGKITVTNGVGTGTSATDFTIIPPPNISSLSPTSALAGSTLTINGSNLDNTTKVNFGATAATAISGNTSSQLKVVIPSTLSPGAVNVSVVTAAGTSNALTFTVAAPVPLSVVSSLQPSTSYKGFPIMILGSNLKTATAVKIGTTAATIVTQYDQSMVITIPASVTNGTYSLTVENPGGPSVGTTLIVVTAPAGVGAPPSAGFLSPPPPNFSNVVSNRWSAFFLSAQGDPNCQVQDLEDDTFCGSITLVEDGNGKVTANLFKFTRGTGTAKETFYGQYSSTAAQPCIQKLVCISAKDGHLLIATVDVTGSYADGNCQ